MTVVLSGRQGKDLPHTTSQPDTAERSSDTLLAAIEEGLRARGLVDGSGRFTAAGRETKDQVEALTDELAQPPYDALTEAELQELVAELEPIAACLTAGAIA